MKFVILLLWIIAFVCDDVLSLPEQNQWTTVLKSVRAVSAYVLLTSITVAMGVARIVDCACHRQDRDVWMIIAKLLLDIAAIESARLNSTQ